MATVNIRFGAVMGAGAPVYALPRSSASITSSGTSQATTIAAAGGDYAAIVSAGGPVWVAIGQAPTAAAGTTFLVPDGGALDVGPLKDGDKVAVIDA